MTYYSTFSLAIHIHTSLAFPRSCKYFFYSTILASLLPTRSKCDDETRNNTQQAAVSRHHQSERHY